MISADTRKALTIVVVLAVVVGITGCPLIGPESAKEACLRLQTKLENLLADCNLPSGVDPADCEIFSDTVSCSALTDLVDCVEPLSCTPDGLNFDAFFACLSTPGLLTSGETCEGALINSGG